MQFRFRYLGPDGAEVEIGSLDDLRAAMKSGAVGEVTLLFDALTREWAPARAHAVYRLLREESDPVPAAVIPAPPSTADMLRDPGLVFSFEDDARGADAERTIRELLREREQEHRPSERVQSVGEWKPEAERKAAPRPAPPEPVAPFAPAAPALGPSIPLLDRAIPLDRLKEWTTVAADRAQHGLRHRALPPTLIVAGLVGLLLVLLGVVKRETAPSHAGGQVVAASLAPDLTQLVALSAVANASGFQNIVAGMDSLRRAFDVTQVPSVWLEGAYLADASSYPEVEMYWKRYRSFLHQVEASDTALFRVGFVKQAAAEGVPDGVLALRLSRAMRGFKETQPERTSVYADMEELASASLALHSLLVERAADIDYAPAIQTGVSREPVVEAVAQDTVLHDRMWSLLERIFASLEKLGGNLGGSRDNLTDMLLQGVEATSH